MNFDLMRSLLIDRALRGELFSNVTSVEAEGKSLEEEQTIPFTIPNHWQWKRVADCVQFNPKVIQDDAVEVSFIPMADVEPGFVDQCSTRQAKPWAKVKKGFSRFQEGDLLVAKITPCFQNRKSCVAKSLINGTGAGSTEFHVMRCVSGVDAKFLLYFFKSEYFIRYGVNHFNGTVGQQRVGAQDIKDCLIPVPSVEEQVRIVAKLEDAFAEIDRAEKAYEELQTLSEVLRSQILQKAIQGELVPQLNLEPAVDMRGDYPEEEPFEIPNKWKWVSLKEVVTFNPKIIKDDALDVSFIPMAGVDAGYVNECETNKLKPWGKVKKSGFSRFEEGDVLLAKITPCFQNRKSCIARNLANETGAGSTEFHVMRCSEYLNPKYLLWFLKSEYFINYGVSHFSGTVGQQRFSTQEVKDCFIPLPPKQEQQRIIEKVDELMKQLDALGGITS